MSAPPDRTGGPPGGWLSLGSDDGSEWACAWCGYLNFNRRPHCRCCGSCRPLHVSVNAKNGATLAEEAAAEAKAGAKAGAKAKVTTAQSDTSVCLVPGVTFASLEAAGAAAAEAAANPSSDAAAEAGATEGAVRCTVEIAVRHRRTFGRHLCLLTGECVHHYVLGAEGVHPANVDAAHASIDVAAVVAAPRLFGEGAIVQVVLDYAKLGEVGAVVDVDFSDPKLVLRGERVRASGVARSVAETPSAAFPQTAAGTIVQLKATEVALLKPFVARARDERLRAQGLEGHAATQGAAADEMAADHGGAEEEEADVAAAFVSSGGGGGDEADTDADGEAEGGAAGAPAARVSRKLRFRARPAMEAAMVMASRLEATKRPDALCKAVLGGHALRVSALASLGV